MKYFLNPKIVIREIVNPRIFATFIERQAIVKNIAAVVIERADEFDLKYLLGLINSKLFTYYLFENTPKSTNKSYPSFSSELIKNLPIKLASKKVREEIALHVEKLLINRGLNCSVEDSQLDEIIFDLYEISSNDRKSIDKAYV